MEIEINKVDAIIDKHGLAQRGLVPSLLEIQDLYHYLPRGALEYVAERMQIPVIQVQQVAEFYKAFSLEPRGKHIITVCLGTACHVEGGDRQGIGAEVGVCTGPRPLRNENHLLPLPLL